MLKLDKGYRYHLFLCLLEYQEIDKLNYTRMSHSIPYVQNSNHNICHKGYVKSQHSYYLDSTYVFLDIGY